MSQTQRNASRSRHRKGWRVAWFFVTPFLFLYVLFLIYPAIQVAYLSLTNSDIAGQGRFIGLANYLELAHDGDFWMFLMHASGLVVDHPAKSPDVSRRLGGVVLPAVEKKDDDDSLRVGGLV